MKLKKVVNTVFWRFLGSTKTKTISINHKSFFLGRNKALFLSITTISSFALIYNEYAFCRKIPTYRESYLELQKEQELEREKMLQPKPIFYKIHPSFKSPAMALLLLSNAVDLLPVSLATYLVSLATHTRARLSWGRLFLPILFFVSAVIYQFKDILHLGGYFRSPGKFLFGLKIVKLETQNPIDRRESFVRILYGMASVLLDPFFFAFSSGNQTFADFVAGTAVVYV